MPRFTEKSAVEDYIIDELSKPKVGWKYIPADELDRESFEEPLLQKLLVEKIKEINNDVELSDEDINNVLNTIKFKPCSQEGIKSIINYFKEGVPIKLEKQRILKNVKLFDFEKIDNNDFIVTRQTYFTNGDNKIRTDIILYINGIPLVNIECKNPASLSEDWTDAYHDIKLYEQDIPELYKYVQIGIAAANEAKYFPIAPWQPNDIRIEEWKAKDVKDSLDATLQMLSRDKLLDIIKNYLFYRIDFGNATKVITRYMQYTAVDKIVNRILDNLSGKTDKKKGLIWHWQGSGKTLEMIFAGYKLYYHKALKNPTIFFIVDRKNLEEQLAEEFAALDIPKPEVIGSVEDLKKVVKHDNYRGKRGLFVLLIHKFQPEKLDELQKELEQLSQHQETITTRENVISFIDEGHRTQYGKLAATRKKILGEYTTFSFAFTGTPILKPGKGVDTYHEFSYGDEEKYLDRYFIKEAIDDKFTVKIAYQPALEDTEGIHLNKEQLETFLQEEYDEIPDDLREVVKDGVRKKLSVIKVYLENPNRIKLIAEHVAKHFKENLDGKYKAMVVAVSREACVHYKRELDKFLPSKYSEVVMSYDDKRDAKIPDIKIYRDELIKRFNDNDTDNIKKEIVGKYKEEEYPKILIVKDMLLTGFNAPILQTMYLDQLLKEHRLLQAIARTNRPYKDAKEAGLIIDYIGILKEFHKAFSLYTEDEIEGVLYDIEQLRKVFAEKLKEILQVFKDIPTDKTDRRTLLKAIEILTSDEETGKKFVTLYKQIRRLFELLGADIIKAELAKEYGWITQIYTNYIKTISRTGEEKLYIEKYFNKTVEYIHQTTELKELDDTLPVIEFDEHYIEKLHEKVQSTEEKAANLVFTLNKYILVNKHRNPIYETVSDKVEKLLDLWKRKTKNFQTILQQGLEIIEELNLLKKRQREIGLNDFSYKLLLVLERQLGKQPQLIEDTKELFNKLDEIIYIKEKKFPNWAFQPTARKDVERTIRQHIRRYIREYNIPLDDMEELYKRLVDYVINNG
jgi:type I restriction enzyme, R subunit